MLQTVDYAKQTLRDLAPDSPRKDAKGKYAEASDSDTDFQARAGAESDGEESAPGGDDEEQVTVRELQETQKRRQSKGVLGSQDSPVKEKSSKYCSTRETLMPPKLTLRQLAASNASKSPCSHSMANRYLQGPRTESTITTIPKTTNPPPLHLALPATNPTPSVSAPSRSLE